MSKSDASTSAHFPSAPTVKSHAASGPQSTLQSIKSDAQRANSRGVSKEDVTPVADCQQEPWLTFHFDGTGNNEKIDVPTNEHSNVARLYRARMRDAEVRGRVTYYIPGIGTPFREIGDNGGNLKSAVAWGGQARLDWAWARFEEQVAKAAARANNPVNKIRMIHVAVFGFSRGAALARAFAVKLQAACQQSGGGWVFKRGQYPIRLYFMGLFDTVASVGVPTAARKYQQDALAAAPFLGFLPVLIASSADGHASWAGDLRIPAMAERCVHHVAAHEIRNSFPLDTALQDGRYPSNVVEVVYPGVHSNVGGGYRPGEGGRLANPFGMLSAVPLQAMYDEAYRAGVPLRAVGRLLQSNSSADAAIYKDFYPVEKVDQDIRNTLIRRFNHYMKTVGQGGMPIGQLVSAHMKLFFRWRIVDIGRKRLAAQAGQKDATAQRLTELEAQWDQELAAKQAKLDAVTAEAASLEIKASALYQAASNTFDSGQREAYAKEAQQCRKRAAMLREQEVPLRAAVDTMPSSDGSLLKNMATYDQKFLKESQRVRALDKHKLTGFDKLLRQAWDEPSLKDPEIIAFFDDYVIDSLAAFDKDRTSATEARVLYQGGDEHVKYPQLSYGDEAAQRAKQMEEAELRRVKQQALEDRTAQENARHEEKMRSLKKREAEVMADPRLSSTRKDEFIEGTRAQMAREKREHSESMAQIERATSTHP